MNNGKMTNPRYLEYSAAHGFENDPDGMLEHDRKTYPVKVMTPFICWHLTTRQNAVDSNGDRRFRR